MDHNGRITERYDVTQMGGSREVDAEYGNQGCDFMGVPDEGYETSLIVLCSTLTITHIRFGWTNASYTYGLHVLGGELQQALREGRAWESVNASACSRTP
jgi:alpha,alpha-trehalase